MVRLFCLNTQTENAVSGTKTVTINVGAACTTAPTGLVSWYRGEGNANDVLNAHPGTLRNGVTFNTSRVGQAFTFDGVDDAIELGAWFNLPTFTLALWVKPGATQTAYANIIDNNHTDNRAWVLQQNGGTLNQYIWGVAGIQPVITFNLTADVWQYVALTLDANRVTRVYVNGVEVGPASGTQAPVYDGTQFLRLGAWGGGGRNWRGQLDEVGIYNRALTTGEVLALFNAGSTGKCRIHRYRSAFPPRLSLCGRA
ncbi:MAG: LamG domain-containing protein [Acidobacteria bacterium]|nr:LamG domain-containing protein [Acidobacteriota bacterium]MBI3423862.1 LamG domain-containing protein [Acidobacteriota bacterium]